MIVNLLGFLSSIDPTVGTIIGIITLIGLLIVPVRKLYRCIRRLSNKLESGMDSLNGYGAIVDPTTGKVLKEATPSMAIRVDMIEQAILTLAETQRQITELNLRLTHMEEWREVHQTWSDSLHPQIIQNFDQHPKG